MTLLADRGFGDQKLFMYLETLGWSYAIRFRQIIHVTHQGRTMSAGDWVPLVGHAKMLRDVLITADKTGIPAVVLKHQKGMKEAWCIATNRVDIGAAGVVKLHARRFTIEETFRDIKDNHFGCRASCAVCAGAGPSRAGGGLAALRRGRGLWYAAGENAEDNQAPLGSPWRDRR